MPTLEIGLYSQGFTPLRVFEWLKSSMPQIDYSHPNGPSFETAFT